MGGNGSGRTEAPRRLDVLIGRWDTEPIGEGRSVGVSRAVFGWVDDGAFGQQQRGVTAHARGEQEAGPGIGEPNSLRANPQ